VLALHFAASMYLVHIGPWTLYCLLLPCVDHGHYSSFPFPPATLQTSSPSSSHLPFTRQSRGRQDSTSQATAALQLLSASPPLHRWRPARDSSPSSRSSPSPPAPRGRQTKRETRSTSCANALRTPTACCRAGIPPS
jgi:hypothetical protein